MQTPLRVTAGILFCLCYAYIDPSQRKKNEPKASACVYLGLTEGFRGFNVLEIDTGRTYNRPDVRFVNNHFPFRATLNRQPTLIEVTQEEAAGVGDPADDAPQTVLATSSSTVEQDAKMKKSRPQTEVAPPKDVRLKSRPQTEAPLRRTCV